jgi:hypothetical protein
MTSSIRNDDYDFIIDNVYNYYRVGQEGKSDFGINYANLISYAYKLGALYCLNDLFSVSFLSPADFILIDDTATMINDVFIYITNRVTLDAGSKLDETIAYSKYFLYKNIFDQVIRDARKIVYENIVLNKKPNYRLTREFTLHMKLDED